MITIQSIDLYSDWISNVKSELESKGYTFTGNNTEALSIQYYNYLKRIIPAKKRQIKKSDIFSCPSELINGLSLLENKILTGQDILPHLSRKLKNLDEIDDLLYDWGIFHIHLGTTIESDGYINRTGPLLFGFYDDDNFYFLNIMPHGSWTKREMLITIHRNWPNTIDNYRLKNKDIINVKYSVTDDDIKQLRKACMNILIEVEPGVVYITPGGGFVASGHSQEVIKNHLNNKQGLIDFEKQIIADPQKFLESVSNGNLSFLSSKNLSFKLVKENNKHFLNELNNNFSIELNQ